MEAGMMGKNKIPGVRGILNAVTVINQTVELTQRCSVALVALVVSAMRSHHDL